MIHFIRSLPIIIFFLPLMGNKGWSCSIKKSQEMISFSGPITTALFQLGLLSDKNLKGILSFHQFNQINKNISQGPKIYLGGIYLSKKDFANLKAGTIIFYDSSKNFEKLFSSLSHLATALEIKTRNRLSLELANEALDKLYPWLDKCDVPIAALRREYKQIDQEIQNHLPLKHNFYFFLGKISPKKLPEIVIGKDLFIRELVEKQKLPWDRQLAVYGPWSAKLLAGSPNAFFMGLNAHPNADEGLNFQKIEFQSGPFKNSSWNINFMGASIPGAFQLTIAREFLKYFSKFEHNKL